jgi:hypothetical protein
MGFSVEKFNEGTCYDVRENLGNLKFLSLEKVPVFEDGKRTDKMQVTHAVVYSEKLGDNLQLKLKEGKTYQELPFMTDIVIEGEVSPFIYNFDNVVGFGDNRQEVTDYGFSLRVEGYRSLAGKQQEAPKEQQKNQEKAG